MIVAFCGHSQYVRCNEDEKMILDFLEKRIGDCDCEFFLGEYGDFDHFAYECAKKYQRTHPNAKLVKITPYIPARLKHDSIYQDNNRFDMILYPDLETVPPRFAIVHRNRWIVKQADMIISYITHRYGGAYTMYRYAKGMKKEIFNIATDQDE